MAKKKNLSEFNKADLPDGSKYKVAIAVSKWNPEITNSLSEAAQETLKAANVTEDNISIVQVPGTFELPGAAKILLQSDSYDGVICIGCVIKGDTKHNEYISHAVATGLTQLSILSGKPCIFGVLTPDSYEQAEERAGGKHGNKGVEAAMAFLDMVSLKKSLTEPKSSIGF